MSSLPATAIGAPRRRIVLGAIGPTVPLLLAHTHEGAAGDPWTRSWRSSERQRRGGLYARDVRPKAGRREWIGLAVILLPTLLYAMDLTVLHLAVPASAAISAHERATALDHRHLRLPGCRLAAHHGHPGRSHRPPQALLIGATPFGLASLLAAFATSAEMLIAARALLGLPARPSRRRRSPCCATCSSTRRNLGRHRGVGVRVLGGICHRPSGGWGVAGALLVGVGLPDQCTGDGPAADHGAVAAPGYRDPDAGRLDLFSAALSLVAVLAVIFGLKQIAVEGLGWPSR